MIVTVNGLQFHVEETGEGPVVLLLHGFPDTGEVWRRQVPALATAGVRAVVPDLRGRGRSERPGRVEAYALRELVADATGILDALGVDRAHVVGHDWGAALAWSIAALAPQRVDRLVVMSVGFPGAVRPDRPGTGCSSSSRRPKRCYSATTPICCGRWPPVPRTPTDTSTCSPTGTP